MDDMYLKAITEIMNRENVEEFEVRNNTDQFKGDNYMGTIIRINVSGRNNSGEYITKDIIIKAAPDNLQVRSVVPVSQYYCTEVHAYLNIFTEFQKIQNKFNIPDENKFHFIDCYYSSLEEPKEFLIIKDVGTEGFVMAPRKEAWDLNHVTLVLKYLARYHALSFALNKLEPDIYKEITKEYEHGYKGFNKTFTDRLMKNALNYIRNDKYKERFAKCATYDNLCRMSMPGLCHPYNVLCHGDIWQANVLFKYENCSPSEVRFVDWQIERHSSPVTDVSHFIFSATEQSLRDNHYEDLLNVYYETLSNSLKSMSCDPQEVYPEVVFRQQLKDVLIYGLIHGVVSLTFALRENDDLEDLETTVHNCIRDTDYTFGFKNPSSANKFGQRLEDIIEHLIKLGAI